MRTKNLLITLALTLAMPAGAQNYPYQNTNLPIGKRVDDLCSRLTLEEKSALMQNNSPAIPRLGIPAFNWWSEALHGVGRHGVATVFPIPTAMAASWDDTLLYNVFTAVSDEARAKNNQAKEDGTVGQYNGLSFWTPNVNIFRDPRWGRGQETYGEDPYLTSRMGLSVVSGLQGPCDGKYRKLLACAKHFAVHSGPEWNRHSFNLEDLPERDLWETYLPAFKTLVKQGNVSEVMCAYQRIDNEPCCGDNKLLQQILRDEWNFNGLVVSDCGAIADFWVPGHHEVSPNAEMASAKAVLSGTDLECGTEYASLPEAVKAGAISEEKIDTSVKRLLTARFELGEFDPDSIVSWTRIPQSTIASEAHKRLALDMAREGMTLLLNKNNILPLNKTGQKIVVLGENATDSVMMWGNYNGYPTHTVTILEGIKAKSPNARYVDGCGIMKNELSESRFGEMSNPDGGTGMRATYWNNLTMSGKPVVVMSERQPIMKSNGGNTVFAPGVNLSGFSAKYEGTLCPTRSERILLSMSADSQSRLIVNGDTLVDNWKGRSLVLETDKYLDVEAGSKYKVQIDYSHGIDMAEMKFDLVYRHEVTTDEIIARVGDADVVVFVGGISPRLEGEEMPVDLPGFKSGDRTTIELPQAQRDLIAALRAAGKHVVFINCSGGAVGLVPETANTEAILQAWYPGEQGGTAVADVLFGDYNPSGKLPVTFYKDDTQLPNYEDYKMQNRTYRYFQGEPLFPFGYGLSYTTFAFGKPEYKDNKVIVSITNTGKVAGTETAQVYVRDVADTEGPIKSLRAFKRVELQPGDTKTVEIPFPVASFEGWDVNTNTIHLANDTYEVMVGGSSIDKDLIKITVRPHFVRFVAPVIKR